MQATLDELMALVPDGTRVLLRQYDTKAWSCEIAVSERRLRSAHTSIEIEILAGCALGRTGQSPEETLAWALHSARAYLTDRRHQLALRRALEDPELEQLQREGG